MPSNYIPSIMRRSAAAPVSAAAASTSAAHAADPDDVAPAPAAAAAPVDATDVIESACDTAGSTAASSFSTRILPPEQAFSGFVFETVVGLQCCCSVGSVRNPDGDWTELLLIAVDAHGDLERDALGNICDDSLLSGGLQLGSVHTAPELHDAASLSLPAFRPLLLSDDSVMIPADLQCHALDEAGAALPGQDRLVRINSMCCLAPLSIAWSLRDAEEVEVVVALGRRSGMVQLLHVPLHCDHDTCSISISRRSRTRVTSPYVKVSQLRSLGPVAHISAFVSSAACDASVIASHGSSGCFSLWQQPYDPCASYARCFLCPSSSPLSSSAVASFSYRRPDRSTCIVIARASAVEVWLYPPGSLARDSIVTAPKADEGVLVASVPASPLCVTAMAALQFECDAPGGGGQQPGLGDARSAVHFVIGYDDGSLRELRLDVWGADVSGSVTCCVLPPARSSTERFPVKFIRPWHHGSCLFVCAWADGCVQVFSSRGESGCAQPASELHRLSPGCALGSMCVSDSAKVYITCANSLIFADLAELLDLAQFSDA